MQTALTGRTEWHIPAGWSRRPEGSDGWFDEAESIALGEADYADLPQTGSCFWWGVAFVCLAATATGYLSVEVAAVMTGFCLLISKQRSELRAIRLELRRLATVT